MEATASHEPEYGGVYDDCCTRFGKGRRRIPATLDSAVVTVGDVLIAVYRSVQESAVERHGEFGAEPTIEGRRQFPVSGQTDLKANVYTPIEELGEDHWWVGLYPCHNERDIWVLRTRRIDHR